MAGPQFLHRTNRRTIVTSVAALASVLAFGLYRFTDLFVKHYPPTPYDDLLNQLTDRGQAIKLGAAVSGPFDMRTRVMALRTRLKGKDLKIVIQEDIASARMVEVRGWVLPQSLVWLSALAAKV